MESRSNMVVFMTLALVATMLQTSSGQTTHVVGDALGWTIPPGGEVAYRTWAATQTFSVGDVLVFNFTTGQHDVTEVNRAGFDSCNGNNPISTSTNGPSNITLRSAGEHFFICTVAGHCRLGQRLAINVSASSVSPAPQPPARPPSTTPPPIATPAPSPARRPVTYTVGDNLGWVVPPGGAVAYQTWARGKNFMVGDILVFNFANGSHNVAQVPEAGFNSCSGSAATSTITTSPARITLTTAGEHFYICTFPQHCSLGQRLAINVTGTSTATPPSSTTTPPPSSGNPTVPGNPTTQSPDTAPPPPNSAAPPSFSAAVLPFTLLTVALAFLY